MAGLFGNLDPKTMGLLSAAASMLQASGPSTTPNNLGQVMGKGLMGGLQGYGMGQQFQQMGEMNAFRKAQVDELKRKGERQTLLQQILSGNSQPTPQPPAPTIEKSLGGPVSMTPVGLQQPPISRGLDAPAPGPSQQDEMRQKAQQLISGGFLAEGKNLLDSANAMEPKGDVAQLNQILDMAGVTDPQKRQEIATKFLEKKTTHQPQVVVNTGTKETDKKFAEDHVAFATGGFADTQKQINQLREVSDALGKAAEGSLTGPLIGAMPEWLRAMANPKSQAAQDAVEEVVQRNLRLILGAQFTEKEGARLIARAYNPRLGEVENKKRVDRLITQIEEAANAKLDASRHFMAHGTLEGWRGKVWTMKDFDPESGPEISPEAQRLLDKYAPRR